MKRISMFGIGMVLLGASVPRVEADVLTLTATRSQVLTNDSSGAARVAFLFDFSELRQGTGRYVAEALLDWEIPNIPANRVSRYRVYPLTSAWNEAGVDVAKVSEATSKDPVGTWEFTPKDYERKGSGLLRFDLADIVQEWIDGKSANFGVVLTTPDVSATTFAAELAKPRLTVRYTFLGDLAPSRDASE